LALLDLPRMGTILQIGHNPRIIPNNENYDYKLTPLMFYADAKPKINIRKEKF
jgi:hypothetical protein